MKYSINKSKELNTSVTLINDKLHFHGIVTGNDPVSIDYIPPLGDNLGYSSLELLLLSLSSCVGSTIAIFLRKMKKTIDSLNVTANGIRREEHPTGFKIIKLNLNLTSEDIIGDDLKRVIKLSEETYCPVWAMLKGNVEIQIDYNISRK